MFRLFSSIFIIHFKPVLPKWSLIVHLVFCMKCDLAHGLVFYSLISMVNILPIIKHEVLNLWRWCWIDQVLLHFQVNLHLARVPGNKNIHCLFSLMAPYFLALATTLENLGARRLLAKKVNFVPCYGCIPFSSFYFNLANFTKWQIFLEVTFLLCISMIHLH